MDDPHYSLEGGAEQPLFGCDRVLSKATEGFHCVGYVRFPPFLFCLLLVLYNNGLSIAEGFGPQQGAQW